MVKQTCRSGCRRYGTDGPPSTVSDEFSAAKQKSQSQAWVSKSLTRNTTCRPTTTGFRRLISNPPMKRLGINSLNGTEVIPSVGRPAKSAHPAKSTQDRRRLEELWRQPCS